LLHAEIHTGRALVDTLWDSLSCWRGSKKAKLIVEGVSQEWGVGCKLKLEGQCLIEVLLNYLLGSEEKRTIRQGTLS